MLSIGIAIYCGHSPTELSSDILSFHNPQINFPFFHSIFSGIEGIYAIISFNTKEGKYMSNNQNTRGENIRYSRIGGSWLFHDFTSDSYYLSTRWTDILLAGMGIYWNHFSYCFNFICSIFQ